MDFDHCFARLTPEQVFVEYLDFIRSIPLHLIESEKKRILKVVEDKLNIADTVKSTVKLDFKSLVHVKSDVPIVVAPGHKVPSRNSCWQ